MNGRLVVNGRSFDTLSAAATALAVTKKRRKTDLNCWPHWKTKFPGETRRRALIEMRREVEDRRIPRALCGLVYTA
ncbi:hypothetical protein VW23_021745 [Devosia insulae DS-56]|uniref:Uncharacterized protein n=1 Tax=Devosia insulae DS-56 TaxID=1116389 RepID=A0A1E5XP42_9HYPH|nr:hypothetical protein VW23_021745 [Devosia insulae DS-56]